jgi:hypothetical protein
MFRGEVEVGPSRRDQGGRLYQPIRKDLPAFDITCINYPLSFEQLRFPSSVLRDFVLLCPSFQSNKMHCRCG